MNLPNLLTLLRMALVPVFIVLFYLDLRTWAAVVFIAAAVTDALDGHIARSRNQITNFGKLMDPLADKILTVSAFICLVDTHEIAAWMVVVILAREFAITGLRGVAAAEGVVIAAGMGGKLKTVFQMLAIILLLLGEILFGSAGAAIAAAVLWVAVILTVYSGVEYLWKGRKLLTMK
ncbi:MAG: CDP-diacylglycerol--glycerol-3-phosphate 3-phosphatidyltransferase [Clostridiales Family XIII bacterium]|jgi:CDP-diacylglycerol--glycerol-3-phosphate 3-phosphatidyltransferase|nr:CDP-diacylglycerol--glycerol-3-phosphate 3-phosphatidyltransferase [Clostridiales Family XIII bacterium]